MRCAGSTWPKVRKRFCIWLRFVWFRKKWGNYQTKSGFGSGPIFLDTTALHLITSHFFLKYDRNSNLNSHVYFEVFKNVSVVGFEKRDYTGTIPKWLSQAISKIAISKIVYKRLNNLSSANKRLGRTKETLSNKSEAHSTFCSRNSKQ